MRDFYGVFVTNKGIEFLLYAGNKAACKLQFSSWYKDSSYEDVSVRYAPVHIKEMKV